MTGLADYQIGDRVVTASTVRPRKFADRVGRVASLSVGEVGVDFSPETSIAHLRADAWFLSTETAPEEAPEEAIDSLCGAPRSPANPGAGQSVPAGAK